MDRAPRDQWGPAIAAMLRATKRVFKVRPTRVIRHDNEDARRVAQMLRWYTGHTGSKLGPSSRGVVEVAHAD